MNHPAARYRWPLVPNEINRRNARDLFESEPLALGGYRRAPVDVWSETFHALDALPEFTGEESAEIAAAASRAARAAYLKIRRRSAVRILDGIG